MTCNNLAAIKQYNMLEKGDSIVVGISGGADSVCLLHLLCSVKDEYELDIQAVHVNHNIRGEEALRDENFVRQYCEKMKVPLKVYSVDVPAMAEQLKIGEEECGRKVRYDCFSQSGCRKTAVAHTASDNCETVLFNISRGTSLRGAAGIRPVRDNIIRPLIFFTRADVEEYCRLNELDYVTDSTNLTDEYTRNSIRLNVIPVLKKINPGLEDAISRFSSLVSAEDEYLEKQSENALALSLCENGYDASKLLHSDKVLLSRGMASLLRKYYGRNYEQKHIELCLEAVYKRKRLQLKENLFLDWKGDCFYFGEACNDVTEPWQVKAEIGEVETPVGSFSLYIRDAKKIPYKSRPFYIDADKLKKDSLTLRSRKQGDVLHDPIRKNSKSLKKLFTEAGIGAAEKNLVPILESDNELVWIMGFHTDKKYCLDEHSEYALVIERLNK